jgi:hypothetical protein
MTNPRRDICAGQNANSVIRPRSIHNDVGIVDSFSTALRVGSHYDVSTVEHHIYLHVEYAGESHGHHVFLGALPVFLRNDQIAKVDPSDRSSAA